MISAWASANSISLGQLVVDAKSNEITAIPLEPILTKSRWCLLKRPENLTDSQAAKLADLRQ